MSTEDSDSGLLFVKPADTASGRVVITPGEQQPYKVVFQLGDHTLSEHPVPTMREGEALIRQHLAHIQFTTQDERPDPEAPKRKRPAKVQ